MKLLLLMSIISLVKSNHLIEIPTNTTNKPIVVNNKVIGAIVGGTGLGIIIIGGLFLFGQHFCRKITREKTDRDLNNTKLEYDYYEVLKI